MNPLCKSGCGKPEENFWRQVEKRGLDECWPWVGWKDRDGYGVIHIGGHKGRTVRVHRLSWALHFGEPQGQVLHSCDVRNCVNPRHLYQGTHQDNMRDVAVRGRRKGLLAGEANPKTRLTWADVQEIRSSRESRTCLARRYGLCVESVSRIIRNELWKEATRP